MANPIHVVFIFDEMYIRPLATAIWSLVRSKEERTSLAIHLVADNVDPMLSNQFRLFASSTVEIDIVDAQADRHLHREERSSYCVASAAALLKFRLPELLPALDKALYLDGDLIVRRDLRSLWDTELENCYVAASLDSGAIYSKNPRHTQVQGYFNSGVMLLNLRKMREDGATERLVAIKRESKDSSLMDQNVFNFAFDGNVRYLSLLDNFLWVNLDRAWRAGKFRMDELNALYGTSFPNLEEVALHARIVHYASADKPWKHPGIAGGREWIACFREVQQCLPRLLYRDPGTLCLFPEDKAAPLVSLRSGSCTTVRWNMRLGLRELDRDDIDARIRAGDFIGLNPQPSDEHIVLSLTSWPPRMNGLKYTLYSLLNQVHPADALVLWLAEEDFPGGEADLPRDVLEFRAYGLQIRWCENLRSYKKFVPAAKAFPDSVIVTADDDLYYPMDWLRLLYWEHRRDARSVIAHRAHKIRYGGKGEILPYAEWKKSIAASPPGYGNFLTGGAGALHPCSISRQEELSRRDVFLGLAPTADDVWFWGMAVRSGRKIRIAQHPIRYLIYTNAEKEREGAHSLQVQNVAGGKNDEQLSAVLRRYPEIRRRLDEERRQGLGQAACLSIVYAADELDAPGLLASLRSLLQHAGTKTFADITVLVPWGFRQELCEEIQGLEEEYPRSCISFVRIRDAALPIPRPAHGGSLAAFYCLLLPTVLPTLDDCIYLGCDTIVLGDLRPVAGLPMDGTLLVGQLRNMDTDAPMDGALLRMDLDGMREAGIPDTCLQMARRGNFAHGAAVLYAACGERIAALPDGLVQADDLDGCRSGWERKSHAKPIVLRLAAMRAPWAALGSRGERLWLLYAARSETLSAGEFPAARAWRAYAECREWISCAGEAQAPAISRRPFLHMPEPAQERPCSVSIVLPVCDMEELLPGSLASALCNAVVLEDAEILVIDDGSKDCSLAIARAFAARWPRVVRVLVQAHSGSGAARNLGLSHARGEYVAFLDADDFYPCSTALRDLYRLAKEQDVPVCGGSLARMQPDGTWTTRFPSPYGKFTFRNDGYVRYRDHQFPFGYQGFLYRREWLLACGIRFPDYLRFQDPPFFVQAMHAAGTFYALRDPVYVYRWGYKRVRWTGRKAQDLLRGLGDIMCMAQAHGYGDLYRVAYLDYRHYVDTGALLEAVIEAGAKMLLAWLGFQQSLDARLLAGYGIPQEELSARRLVEAVSPYIDVRQALQQMKQIEGGVPNAG